jgi:glycosyltransferase involved in cell wall biosynthesis
LTRRPTVTVVVPCFNYGHYLPTAVRSVLEQPGVDVDVILIDDASTDGSDTVVRSLAAADDRIRAILHNRNRGHIATYNEGLEQAAGDYLVLLSADDALTPGALARAAALLDAEPSVGLVYGFPIEFANQFSPSGAHPPASARVRNWTVWSGDDWIRRRCQTGRNCIMNPEVVMRNAVQNEIGGYDPDLPHSGDLEMWLRAAAVSDVGRVNGPAQAYYRVHDQSMQRTIHAGHLRDLQGRLEAFQKTLVGPKARVQRGDELFSIARRALASSALDYARSAYDNGRADLEPVDAYLAFATEVCSDVRDTRAWRSLARYAASGCPRAEAGIRLTARRFVRDVKDRAQWRRWRWNGV